MFIRFCSYSSFWFRFFGIFQLHIQIYNNCIIFLMNLILRSCHYFWRVEKNICVYVCACVWVCVSVSVCLWVFVCTWREGEKLGRVKTRLCVLSSTFFKLSLRDKDTQNLIISIIQSRTMSFCPAVCPLEA